MSGGVFFGQTGRILVTEDAEQKTDEVPDTNEDAIVAPIARFSNELSVEDRWTKGEDSYHYEADIFATGFDRYNFACSSKCNELIETSADTREDVASYYC